MAKLTGVDKWIKKSEKYEAGKLKDLQLGLMEAGLFLQRASQEIVPVDQGPLKASAYTRKDPKASKYRPVVLVGYTAEYAIYVHEIPDPPTAHGRSFNNKHAKEIAAGTEEARGPNQVYKFLETPARQKRQQILDIIKRRIKK